MPESAEALLVATVHAEAAAPLVWICRSEPRAERVARLLHVFAPGAGVVLLPPWDTAPYERLSPSRRSMGRRVAALHALSTRPAAPVVVTTPEAVLQRLPQPDVRWDAFAIAAGGSFDADRLREWALRNGYVIDEPGEIAFRGSVVEVFPGDADDPFRLDLEEGRIGTLRRYDELTQRTLARHDRIALLPVSELALGDPGALTPETRAALTLPDGSFRQGAEAWMPLVAARLVALADLLPDAIHVVDAEARARMEAHWREIEAAFRARTEDRMVRARGIGLPPLEPGRLHVLADEWERRCAPRVRMTLGDAEAEAWAEPIPAGRPHEVQAVIAAASARAARIVLAAENDGRHERLARRLSAVLPSAPERVREWRCARGGAGSVSALCACMPAGFVRPEVVLVAAADVLGAIAGEADAGRTLAAGDPRPGDRVVTWSRGVGVLRGLEPRGAGDAREEHLAIDHADGAYLLPAFAADAVWRYGSDTSTVALDRLHGGRWPERRAELERAVEAAGRALIARAQQRSEARAPVLAPPADPLRRFAAGFPHALTPDQAAAVCDVLADLRAGPPMDRLVCGDVGFGKTEIALRACAAAALCGRQVAFLAPTSVLARQHEALLRRRFSGFDIEIAYLAGGLPAAEGRRMRKAVAEGAARIVIGTHALLSGTVRFKDLALVVIDEEQRFGTRHKAALGSFRTGRHVLTMTATPIPRTMQAALAGVRDVSLVLTPPVRRRPIRTFVLRHDPAALRDALGREHRRGGQSFVVCPRIEDLEPMEAQLRTLAPALDIVRLHGRMRAAEIDAAMLAFANGAYDILLSTDIIETGLDIPRANTIVIWRPDRFGLAQLHQLRGRVGRGRARGVAYLVLDPAHPVAPATEQRLRALQAHEALGSGFALSLRDLDLRGAGDVTGDAQAGHGDLLGSDLYADLLDRAVRRARRPDARERPPASIEIAAGARIPDDYVPEPALRIASYRALARAETRERLNELADEMADRFGPLPEPLAILVRLHALRVAATETGVTRVRGGPAGVALEFHAAPQTAAREPAPSGWHWRDDHLVVALDAADAAAQLEAAERAVAALA